MMVANGRREQYSIEYIWELQLAKLRDLQDRGGMREAKSGITLWLVAEDSSVLFPVIENTQEEETWAGG
jgi:hypothetical protein